MATYDFYATQHDNLVRVRAQCQDAEDTPVDLTGTRTEFLLWTSGQESAPKVQEDAIKESQLSAPGWCYYDLTDDDLDTAGVYLFAFRVVFPDGTEWSFPSDAAKTLLVRASPAP